jgi:hypothetical protein
MNITRAVVEAGTKGRESAPSDHRPRADRILHTTEKETLSRHGAHQADDERQPSVQPELDALMFGAELPNRLVQ